MQGKVTPPLRPQDSPYLVSDRWIAQQMSFIDPGNEAVQTIIKKLTLVRIGSGSKPRKRYKRTEALAAIAEYWEKHKEKPIDNADSICQNEARKLGETDSL